MILLLCIFAILFFTRRSRFFNVYVLGTILLYIVSYILNKTFFAPRENIDLYDFQMAIFIFAFMPALLLTLSVLTFFSSKVLMEKEGRRLKNLFISLIGIASIAIVVLFFTLYINSTHSITFDLVFYYFIGLFFYFIWLFTATAIYAWICTIMPVFYKPAYIVVLGSGLIKDRVPPLLASRIEKGVKLFNKYEQKPLLIMSGGQGSDELLAEADAMKKYAIEHLGVHPDQIIAENKSTTTYENLLFSKRIIEDHLGTKSKGVFVTNNFHVFRASIYATRVKLKALGVGSKTAFYFVPNAFMREFIGIMEMKKWRQFILLGLYTLLFILLFNAYN